ncbi:phosphoglycerate kinase [Brevundimonas sp. PAMC22021]|uniref:phosphoglycerate kinase n=1 Tax=Brevundimonas sp. PAMC22021 TaxID=2861285 RepID=UPI001C6343B7|nr:phosphoglycerate kinase [Brevundimonas sp. PAMC22021]QYF86016.1 phosphoglycerate kinase [Brevundimonas sp. PAMC22021]
MTFRTLDDATDLAGKTALVRVDFNVPMEGGKVTDDTRLRVALPTIERLRNAGAKVALLAHFDRPKGDRVPSMSLKPVVDDLERLLGAPVRFAEDCVGDEARAVIADLDAGGVALLENVRFHKGEEKNDPAFAQQLAALGDLYVNDAFSAAHRAHASTEGLARLLPAYAGESMRRELEALDKALGSPIKPVLGIVGGSKVSTKLDLLKNLVGKLDQLAIGGGMANTFLYAQGVDIGGSLAEKDMADTAREIMAEAEAKGCELLLPVDVVVATEVRPGVDARAVKVGDALSADDKILDAGPETVARLTAAMDAARTLIWNGPLGVFEVPPFDAATVAAAKHAAELAKAGKLTAVAGGGDTVAALNHAGVANDMTFVSTAGGAFLEWMEGKPLPGVEALRA